MDYNLIYYFYRLTLLTFIICMDFNNLILKWYDKIKRKLPWRKTKNPYNIWISEIILQQTRMQQGVIYYNKFISKFPNLESLAKSDEEDVLLLWQGLGYYSRARNLHSTAKYIHNELGSDFPETYEDLLKLKGIGDYTASAISSICFEKKHPVLDGNVFRIISRIFEIYNPIDVTESRKIFKEKALEIMPKKRFGDYNQALMDFGSIVCRPVSPLCNSCEISTLCVAFKKNTVTKLPVKSKKRKVKKLFFDYALIRNDNKYLIERINEGIWKNLYQFPVHTSKTKKNKKTLNKFFSEKFLQDSIEMELINSEFIEHNLSHIKIKSRFWLIINKTNINDGIFTEILDQYPMSKLMHRFIEKYGSKLSIS